MNATQPTTPQQTVEAYFRAMQLGPADADDLFALFADHATYSEPFSGTAQVHRGRDAIASYLRRSWQTAPPDMSLTVDRIDVADAVVTTHWTCASPAFPQPMRGQDVCTVEAGRIVQLHVTFLPPETP